MVQSFSLKTSSFGLLCASTGPQLEDEAPLSPEDEGVGPLDALITAMEARAAAAAHLANADLVRTQVRPLVSEAMRLQADVRMRALVQQLKVGEGSI